MIRVSGRRRTAGIVVALAATFAMSVSAVVADNMQVDNDVSLPGLQNTVDLGLIAGGSAQSTTAYESIVRQGNNHLAAGDVVTFVQDGAQSTAGVSATGVSITIPDPWDTLNQRVQSNASTVSFTAPTASGNYTYTVKFKVNTGPACLSDTPSCLTDSTGDGSAFTITFSIAASSCSTDYVVTAFYQPVDVAPTTNTIKNGRVVPVKVSIEDACTHTPYTGDVPTLPTGKVTGLGTCTPTSDAIEEFQDAGASNSNTNAFRWSATDGFWIYNLDTKALGLVTNSCYRIDVYVGSDKATTTLYAIIKPTK